jgi:hypothetical protein
MEENNKMWVDGISLIGREIGELRVKMGSRIYVRGCEKYLGKW